MITLSNEQLNNLNAHFTACYPEEGVCFVVNNELIFLENIHPSPKTHFKVNKDDYLKYINTVQAVIHSHPIELSQNNLDPRTPSPSDVNNQIKMDVPWGIVSIDKNTMSDILWVPGDLNAPLYNREFIYGAYDCYEFVRSFYWQKFNLTLDKPLGHNWSLVEDSFITDRISTLPFEEVSINEMQPNDLVTFRRGSNNISHFGVYLGADRLAHHLENKQSCIDRFRKYRPFTYKVYRPCLKSEK